MKTLFYLFCWINSLLLLITLSGCEKKEEGCKNTHTDNKVSALIKDAIPFRKDGLDTLTFISSFGDTARLYGVGSNSAVSIEQIDGGNSDCGNEYNDYEILYYSFVGNKPAIPSITFHIRRQALMPSGYGCYFGSNPIIQPQHWHFNSIETSPLSFDENNYSDTIMINNETVKGINILLKGINGRADSSINVFYNYQYGITRIRTITHTWNKQF